MAMSFETSKTLHNFSSLPCFKWGRQKHCQFFNAISTADQDRPSSSGAADFFDSGGNRRVIGGMEATSENPMLDFRSQMNAAVFSAEGCDSGGSIIHNGSGGCGSGVDGEAAAAVEARQWNLRTRRAVSNTNNSKGGEDDRYQKPRYTPTSNSEVKSLSGKVGGYGGCGKNGPRPKFSASLSKREIDEDFLAILGTRPAKRPKRRPRNVQKQINEFLPGYYLSEITADMYKVKENAESRKH